MNYEAPITIPEYFKTYVDPSVDLTVTHNVPCPFHNEQSGKSFTYSADKNIWRCWGACHFGGDVFALHQLHYHLHTRESAIKSLYKLLGKDYELVPTFEKRAVHIDKTMVERNTLYARACEIANNLKDIDAYIELDYILSKVPFDTDDIKNYIQKYEVKVS